jgi:hypothetical protein
MRSTQPIKKLLLLSAALIACSSQAADPAPPKLEPEVAEQLVRLCEGTTCYDNVTLTQAKSIMLTGVTISAGSGYTGLTNPSRNIRVENPDRKPNVPSVYSPQGEGGKARQWKIELIGPSGDKGETSVHLEKNGTANVYTPRKDWPYQRDAKLNLEQLRQEFGGNFDISMPVHGFDAKGKVIPNQYEVKLKTAPDGSGYGVVSKDGVPVYSQKPELKHASFGSDSKPAVSGDNPGLTNGTVDHAPKK